MLAWDQIDLLLVDMDGTVLDLSYDNHFWLQFIPSQYAQKHGLSHEEACDTLFPRFKAAQGTMAWYCIDHWSNEIGLDIAKLKRENPERIKILPGAMAFLRAAKAHNKTIALVTNAHKVTLEVKLAFTGIEFAFDEIYSSHEFGAPKEHQEFWQNFIQQRPFDPQRAVMIDDSLSVLQAAKDFGIGHQLAIAKPDSKQPARDMQEFTTVDQLGAAADSLSIPER